MLNTFFFLYKLLFYEEFSVGYYYVYSECHRVRCVRIIIPNDTFKSRVHLFFFYKQNHIRDPLCTKILSLDEIICYVYNKWWCIKCKIKTFKTKRDWMKSLCNKNISTKQIFSVEKNE